MVSGLWLKKKPPLKGWSSDPMIMGRLPANDVINNQHSGDSSGIAKQQNKGKSKAIHLTSDVIAKYISNGLSIHN